MLTLVWQNNRCAAIVRGIHINWGGHYVHLEQTFEENMIRKSIRLDFLSKCACPLGLWVLHLWIQATLGGNIWQDVPGRSQLCPHCSLNKQNGNHLYGVCTVSHYYRYRNGLKYLGDEHRPPVHTAPFYTQSSSIHGYRYLRGVLGCFFTV